MLYSVECEPPVTRYVNTKMNEFTGEKVVWGENWDLERFIDWFQKTVTEARAAHSAHAGVAGVSPSDGATTTSTKS